MNEILRWGLFAIGIVFLIMGGYYLNAVERDADLECSECLDQDCMDNDIVCGDFGQYWVKFAILFAIMGLGVAITSCMGGWKQ